MTNWGDNRSDLHDYFNELDEGYLSYAEFHLYNKIKPLYVNTHTDEEIFSMVMSEAEE